MTPMRSWRFALVGKQVAYTLSPTIHQTALRDLGMSGRYEVLDVTAAGLSSALQSLRAGEFHGLNVTQPFKLSAAASVDYLVGAARTLRAVNTLVSTDNGTIEGHNTDVPGLQGALIHHLGCQDWGGLKVLIVGAGGASRAAILALDRLGAGSLTVCNRSPERAARLVSELREEVSAELCQATQPVCEVDLIVQASSVGSGWDPESDLWSTAQASARELLQRTRPRLGVFDLVYRPEPTPWMCAATELGLEAVGGREMLIRQAALSFELWTGSQPSLLSLRHAVRYTDDSSV